jgi:hypothetical protein
MDELDAATAGELDAHLRTCTECAEEAQRLRELWRDASAEVPAPSSELLVRFGRRLERRRPSAWRTRILQAAAAVLLVAVGTVGGQLLLGGGEGDVGVAPVIASGNPEFMLLIRATGMEQAPPNNQLVAEYGQWAHDLAAEGRLVSAEELASTTAWVSDAPRSLEERERAPIEGFFLVRARDYDEAVALARGHPHVGYGGTIEVRAINHQ